MPHRGCCGPLASLTVLLFPQRQTHSHLRQVYPSPPAAVYFPQSGPPTAIDTILQGLAQDLASEASFTEGLSPSLLHPALQSDLFTVFGEPSPLSDYSALSDDDLLQLYDPTTPPGVVMVTADLQELGQTAEPMLLEEDNPAGQDTSMPAAVAAATLAVGDTTQLATSLATFVTNLVAAFSQLFSDLQAALTANPALAFLILIPFLFLPFLHQRHRQYGGGYHRRVYFVPHGRSSRDVLARQVLADLDHLARLYGARNDTLLIRGLARRLPSSSHSSDAH